MHLLVGFKGIFTCTLPVPGPGPVPVPVPYLADDQLYDGCFVKGRKRGRGSKLCSCVYINEDHEFRFFYTFYSFLQEKSGCYYLHVGGS